MTYSFSYTSGPPSYANVPAGFDPTVSLVLTVGPPAADGSVQITGISGTWHGQTVTGLVAPGGYGAAGTNDNRFFPADNGGKGLFGTPTDYADSFGFAFTVAYGAGQMAGDNGAGQVLFQSGFGGSFSYTFDKEATGYQLAGVGNEVFTACFCRGTAIATPSGPVAVEALTIGDDVSTWARGPRPVRWIGRRSYGQRFVAAHAKLRPIRIRAGALADGVPGRDLFVSPDHALFLRGVLVPAAALANGTTVQAVPRAEAVDYFHVELDDHDVIFAEGAAAETFVDDDSRKLFHNANDGTAPARSLTPPQYCASRVEEGYTLEVIRAELQARAACQAAA